jgi:hypothetical protein
MDHHSHVAVPPVPQGLNAFERRTIRRQWKKKRQLEATKRQAQARQDMLLQEARQDEAQAEVARRRELRVMQQARAEAQELVWLQGMPMAMEVERSSAGDGVQGDDRRAAQQEQEPASAPVDDDSVFDDW